MIALSDSLPKHNIQLLHTVRWSNVDIPHLILAPLFEIEIIKRTDSLIEEIWIATQCVCPGKKRGFFTFPDIYLARPGFRLQDHMFRQQTIWLEVVWVFFESNFGPMWANSIFGQKILQVTFGFNAGCLRARLFNPITLNQFQTIASWWYVPSKRVTFIMCG